MRPAGFQRPAQRCTSAQQMGLPDEFIQGLRAQPIGQWPVGTVADRGHGARPITSTPGGGEKENRPGANSGLRIG